MADYRLMRVCISGHYTEFFTQLVQMHRPASADETMALLYSHDFIYPPSFRDEMAERGVEVVEVYSDFPPLQRMYLEEAGRSFKATSPGSNLESAFLVNVERVRPDVVYFQSFDAIPHRLRKRIKQEFPFVRLVAGHNGYMPANLDHYTDVDLAFIAFPTLIRAWKAAGIESEYLPHAFDPRSVRRLQSMAHADRIGLSFVGHTGYGLDRHSHRYFLLRRLLGETDLMIWGLEHGASTSLSPIQRFRLLILAALMRVPLPVIKAIEARLGSNEIQRIVGRLRREHEIRDAKGNAAHSWFTTEKPLGELYPGRVKLPSFGPDYLHILARSDITINCHTELTREGLNMRMFEATGAGTCLVTDHREGIEDMFEPDRDVMIYHSAEECLDKIRFLSANPSARAQIAQSGHARTLRDHMTRNRVDVIDRKIRTML
jgi:spore maturation protein CgeB